MTEVRFGKRQYHLIEDMNSWCKNNIGAGGWLAAPDHKWKIEGAFGEHTYTFKDPKDAVLFMLRWK